MKLATLIMVVALVLSGDGLEEREKITRDIVRNMVDEDFSAVQEYFANSLKQQLPPQIMSQVWTSVLMNIGEFEQIAAVSEREVQGYTVVKARCKFKNDYASVEVTFNDEEKVIGLYVKP